MANEQQIKFLKTSAYQEAHEVKGKYGGHSSEGQALEHGAADPGRKAEVLWDIGAGAVLIALAQLCFTARNHHEQS